MEQIDYNFSKSEKAKGTQKRAAIGNQVFEPDSQCCRTIGLKSDPEAANRATVAAS
jgi:hypothetical protein